VAVWVVLATVHELLHLPICFDLDESVCLPRADTHNRGLNARVVLPFFTHLNAHRLVIFVFGRLLNAGRQRLTVGPWWIHLSFLCMFQESRGGQRRDKHKRCWRAWFRQHLCQYFLARRIIFVEKRGKEIESSPEWGNCRDCHREGLSGIDERWSA
jgi:hypothetical protein